MTSRRPLLLVAAALVLGACSDRGDDATAPPPPPPDVGTLEEGVLTACVAPVPGLLEQVDGEWVGSEAEVVLGIAADLQLEPVFVEVSYDELVSGMALNDDRCDLGAGALVDDEALAAVARPSTSYGVLDRLVVALGAEEQDPDQVTGRVGVEEGGPAVDATDALPGAELVSYPSVADLERALGSQQVDAALVTYSGWERLGRPDVRSRVPAGGDLVLVLPLAAEDALVEAVDASLEGRTP